MTATGWVTQKLAHGWVCCQQGGPLAGSSLYAAEAKLGSRPFGVDG